MNLLRHQTPLNSYTCGSTASPSSFLRNGPAKGHTDSTPAEGKILSPRTLGRIQNDECEYSHGRARNKAVGENVGELFVRRALAQKSMTKSARFMGATGRGGEGRDGAELRTRRKPTDLRQQQRR